MAETERGNRKYWVAADVVEWIKANTEASKDHPGKGDPNMDAAIWWVCYRNAEAIMDGITTKEMARYLSDGLAAIDEPSDVDDHLQCWTDEAGDEGDKPGIDEAIEQDLKDFFIEGR